MSSRRALAAGALALALPASGWAQGIGDASWRLSPQVSNYSFEQGGRKTTVEQSAIPIAMIVPLSSRLTFDVATAFATSRVTSDNAVSEISGLTDTQLRFNYTIGTDAVVLTAGLNVPTGQYEVAQDAIAAAGQIGNDFLAMPVSSYGNGIAGTGGIAIARPVGDWNVGVGASFRKSTEFGAFEQSADVLRFQPADEIRVRVGVDRLAFGGRVVLGVIYSAFGEDIAATTTYSTGDRIITQAALDMPLGAGQLFVSSWHLQRMEGEQIGGLAPPEGISNISAGYGLTFGSLFLEPNVEARRWTIDGGSAGTLAYAGLRTRLTLGPLLVFPSVSVGSGSLKSQVGSTDLSGFKGGLAFRLK